MGTPQKAAICGRAIGAIESKNLLAVGCAAQISLAGAVDGLYAPLAGAG